MQKSNKPLAPWQAMNQSPRCGAKCKRTGQPCKAPAVRNYNRCRMHGARGGRPAITGLHTKQMRKERQHLKALMRQCNELLDDLNKV